MTAPFAHLALLGPTASGKSALAMALARTHADLEVVSVDSMQVYRGMDVGTAKPTVAEQGEVPHHLIDLVDPSEDFTVAQFQRAFRLVMGQIEGRHHRALLVGGTGLYLRAVIDDLDLPGRYPEQRIALDRSHDTEALHARLALLDPVAAARMEPTNRRRVLRALEVTLGSGRPFSSFGPGLDRYPPTPFTLVGLHVERPELDERIGARFQQQMAHGWLGEIERLQARPGGMSRTAAQALGYRELAGHLAGECTLEDAVDSAVTRTRRFARRQQRWFRRDPRVIWVDACAEDNAVAHVAALLGD